MATIENGNNLNLNQSKKGHPKKTKFINNTHLRGTYRFGELGIIASENGIAADNWKIRQDLNVDSYTMGAPLKQPIYMTRCYFEVPRMAILPKTWEKIYTNPSIGDDINATVYGTSVNGHNMYIFITNIWENCISATIQKIFTDESTIQNEIKDIFNNFIIAEAVLSKGNIAAAMGAHLHNLYYNDCTGEDFDQFFEKTINSLAEYRGSFTCSMVGNNETTFRVILPKNEYKWPDADNVKQIPLRKLLNMLRDGEVIDTVISVYDNIGNVVIDTLGSINWVEETYPDTTGEGDYYIGIAKWFSDEKPFDIAKLWAYQLSCAEFFTNDKVDYIYSAELYRQYIGNLLLNMETNGGVMPYYELNGVKYEADYLSAAGFEVMLDEWARAGELTTEVRAYILALFKYNRSLKFKDYFTGARTRPIAIGDTDIAVEAGDHVEVINVVKNIQKQRFLNVVNKIPRDLKGYTKGIFGKDVAPDWHNPLMLGRVTEVIYGAETENTGEAQMKEKVSRTTTLMNQGNKYQFEVTLDRNAIIIGIVYFDIERTYTKGIKRDFFHVDRFDMFNPYLQYTGDQEIYGAELNTGLGNKTFGYTGAYMEFKQENNNAFGGFLGSLPGWAFTDDYIDGEYFGSIWDNEFIGPDFIRSKQEELDKFYISLEGYSMKNYFHFIIDTTNHTEATRPMALNPQILG